MTPDTWDLSVNPGRRGENIYLFTKAQDLMQDVSCRPNQKPHFQMKSLPASFIKKDR